MQSSLNRPWGRRRLSVRSAMLTGAMALLTLAITAPGAFAWHAHLQVRKITLGGPPSDVFNFKIEKTPNLYEDIWDPGYKLFDLHGAPSAAGPWYERYGPGPSPSSANMESFGDLWAGYDHGFADWVTYKVSELSSAPSPLSDYTTTAACEINGGTTWTTSNEVTEQYGLWSYTAGVTDGQTHVSTSVRWINDVRYVTTCTFTNRYRARVRVKKTFADPVTAQPSVIAEINGSVRARATDDGTPVAPADTTLEHGENTEWVNVPVGPEGPTAPVVVAERDGDAGDPPLSAYAATIDCGAGITATLDAQSGKWTLGGIQPGQDVTCTIHNTRKVDPPPTTPPTSQPSAGAVQSDVAGGATSGLTTAGGAARLSGTVGCASARYAHASVSGSKIRRVTFYVNGRKVKTLARPNAGKLYQLRYRTKGLRAGSYAVRARVEFTSASKTAPRTFGLRFSRCSRRAVRPTFTG